MIIRKKNLSNNYIYLVNTKREVEAELNSKIESIRKEKEEISNKLSNKKREHRELEQAFLKQTCIYDKEKQQLNEKISSLESKMKEICEHYKSELEKISIDMNGLKEESDHKANEFRSTIEDLRQKNVELERENKNMLIKKSDLKNKIELLENQIEENKISMLEMQNRCESFIKNALSKAQLEKDQLEKEKEKLSIIEQNYYIAYQKMEEENKKLIEVTRDHKEIEDELISLSRQATSSLKLNDPISLTKKIQELLNTQDSLNKELKETRLDKDKKIAEIISKHEREKEIFKIKILECEVKLKNCNLGITSGGGYELKKSGDSYEMEKEKIKWRSEKEKLMNTIENLNMQVQKIEKKSETLFKENEQFKLSQGNSQNLNNNFKESNMTKNFANSSNVNNNTNFFSNNDEEKYSPRRVSKTSKHNVSTLNDKEILLDTLKKTNNLNLNMQMMNSPLGEKRKSNAHIKNNINNQVYANDENNYTSHHQAFSDINSPNLPYGNVNKKDFITNQNLNVNLNNNYNNSNKLSPFINPKK